MRKTLKYLKMKHVSVVKKIRKLESEKSHKGKEKYFELNKG